jgi:hypothetical protein
MEIPLEKKRRIKIKNLKKIFIRITDEIWAIPSVVGVFHQQAMRQQGKYFSRLTAVGNNR